MLNLKPYLKKEFKRLYHGRGEKTYKFLTIDSIDKILLVQFYEKVNENPFLEYLKGYIQKTNHDTIIVKRRYSNETFAFVGEIPSSYYAIENDFKFIINFRNQNIGYFGDMKHTREYVEKIAKNKKVLNLFAYTCGFSLYARRGRAKEIINIDMNKSVLKTGMKNHQIYNLDLKNIHFLQKNILKSFSKIKQFAPYDIIIIDPPSFQKGSFNINRDYEKIIKRLKEISHQNTAIIACANSPRFSKEELINLVEKYEFKYKEEITPPKEYTNSTLKCLIFSHTKSLNIFDRLK